MWEDMGLYWAWRGKEKPTSWPPTKKRIEYAEIVHTYPYLNGPKKASQFAAAWQLGYGMTTNTPHSIAGNRPVKLNGSRSMEPR